MSGFRIAFLSVLSSWHPITLVLTKGFTLQSNRGGNKQISLEFDPTVQKQSSVLNCDTN